MSWKSSFISVIQLKLWNSCIKRTKNLNYFCLCALNWFNTWVSQFWLTFNKNPPIHYLNQLEYFIRPIKIFFLVNCWSSGKYVHLLYMYSILGRGSFCFNYCLNSAWHGGDQFVALLRWYGSPGFFDSGLQLICIFWSLVSHFPLDNTP